MPSGAGRLPDPTRGEAFNPTCGDKVVVDLNLEDGRVSAFAHDTKACIRRAGVRLDPGTVA